jgi:multiple sugar transport system substrate-binding protein
METNGSPWKKIIAIIAGVLLIGGIALIFMLPAPQTRHYPKRIEVRFWHMWTGEWANVVDKIAQEYNKSQTKYEVVPLSVPSSAADTKFLLAVSGGNPPDVMAQWNPVIPSWADKKLLIPLDEMMTPAEWKEFQGTAYPIAKKIGIYKGKLYGVTTGTNVWALYYNCKHLKEAGLDPKKFPTTLEELMIWGNKLNKFDARKNLTRMGFLPTWYAEYAPVFGGGFYDWNSEKLTLNSPQNLRALTFLVNARKKIGYNNVVRFESGLSSSGSGSGDWPFIKDFYSIALDGQWRVEEIRKLAEDTRKNGDAWNFEYGTAPLPPPAGGKSAAGFADGNFLVIPRGAKQAQGAWEFIKFWSGIEKPECAAKFYTWGGWMPINAKVANAPAYQKYVRENPQFKTFLDLMPSENLEPSPPVSYQIFLTDRIGRTDDFATRGSLSPEQALKSLEKDIAAEQARRREFHYDEN